MKGAILVFFAVFLFLSCATSPKTKIDGNAQNQKEIEDQRIEIMDWKSHLTDHQNQSPILTALLRNDFDEAKDLLEDKNIPDSTKNYFGFLIHYRTGDMNLNEPEVVDKIVDDLEKKPNIFIEQFLISWLISRDKDLRADQILRRLVEKSPDQSHWPAWMGWLYLKSGNLKRARYQFQRSISLAGDQAMAWFGLGITFETERKFERAKRFYTKALSLQPWSGRFHHRMALLQIKRENYKQASYHVDAVKKLPVLQCFRFIKKC